MTYTPLEKAILLGLRDLLKDELTPPKESPDSAGWEKWKQDALAIQETGYAFLMEGLTLAHKCDMREVIATIRVLRVEGLVEGHAGGNSFTITREGLLACRELVSSSKPTSVNFLHNLGKPLPSDIL